MITVLLLCFSLAGCEAGSNEGSTSRAEVFESVEDLASQADVILVVTSTDRTRVEKVGLAGEFRVAEVQLGEVLKGQEVVTNAEGLVEVRQTDAVVEGVDARLKADTDYVLFLRRFEFERGKPYGNQYVVLGESSGVFKVTEGDGTPVAKSLDTESPSLARETPLDELRQLAAA